MQYLTDFEWGTEDHCYFPEWADRPVAGKSLHELDRNSYLAGGYAEEFGHRARFEEDPATLLRAEEEDEWRMQVGCLHPGYPECPRPLDREAGVDGGKVAPAARPRPQRLQPPGNGRPSFKVVVVGNRAANADRRHPSWRLWREFRMRRRRLPLG